MHLTCAILQLACVKLPSDEDQIADAIEALEQDTLYKPLLLNVEYKASCQCVSLMYEDSKVGLFV